MTLNQWLTSTDPAAMLAALGEQADERRCEIAARSVRKSFEKRMGFVGNWGVGSWKNRLMAWNDDEDALCDIIRCLWPSPFIERERTECENCNGLGSIEAMDSICQLVECKMCKGRGYTLAKIECPECKNWSIRQKESITRMNCKTCDDTLFTLAPLINPRWRTPLVLDLARQVRGKDAGWYCKSCGKECGTADFWCHCGDKATRSKSDAIQPNPGAMLPLSDVLFEAGCDVPEIIDHLKCGVHGPECWVIGALLNGQ